jgi:hypothetical protein
VTRAFAGSPGDAFRIALVAAAGIGVQIDEANTLSWFVLAAGSGGDRAAPTLVAYRVLQSIGVAADPVTAAQWFRLGADRGDPHAMIALEFCVGIVVCDGKGSGPESLDCRALVDAGQWPPHGETTAGRRLCLRIGSRAGSEPRGFSISGGAGPAGYLPTKPTMEIPRRKSNWPN